MKPRRWVEEFTPPPAASYAEMGHWPFTAYAVKQVILPTLPSGVTGGTIWVRILDQALPDFPGGSGESHWLRRLVWTRERIDGQPDYEYTQTVTGVFATILNGEDQADIEVAFDTPYDVNFFIRTTISSAASFGPLPLLTTAITPTSWDLDPMYGIEASVRRLAESWTGRRGRRRGTRVSWTDGESTLLAPGTGSAVIEGRLLPGTGYQLGQVGGRQLARFPKQARGGGAWGASLSLAFYYEGDGTDGWEDETGGAVAPYTRQITKVAIAYVVTEPSGRRRVRAAGSYYVSGMLLQYAYSAGVPTITTSDEHVGPIETFASKDGVPVEVAGAVIAGQFNPDGSPVVASVSNYDTWPQMACAINQGNSVVSGTGTLYVWDIPRAEVAY